MWIQLLPIKLAVPAKPVSAAWYLSAVGENFSFLHIKPKSG